MKLGQFSRPWRSFGALSLGFAVLAGGALAAVGNQPTDLSPARVEALVKHRQATMKRLGEHMRSVIAFVKGGPGTPQEITVFAWEIKGVADQMTAMFPQGSGMADALPVPTGAKPEIWADWTDFSEQAQKLSEESAKLAAVAAEGGKPAIRRQFMVLGKDGCSGCHERYREKI